MIQSNKNTEVTRHFTATTFVVFKSRTLLHLHKKLNMWLPPGGHIDRDELPEEAAIREVKEEAGLDVKLYNPDNNLGIKDSKQILRPQHILLEDINEFHQHVDLIYYAYADKDEVNSAEGETDELKWLSAEEIKKFDLQDDVRIGALEAIKLLS